MLPLKHNFNLFLYLIIMFVASMQNNEEVVPVLSIQRLKMKPKKQTLFYRQQPNLYTSKSKFTTLDGVRIMMMINGKTIIFG